MFSTSATFDYKIASVDKSFLQQNATTTNYNISNSEWLSTLHAEAAANSLQRLDNLACIDSYAQTFLGSRSDLLLVVGASTGQRWSDEVTDDAERHTGVWSTYENHVKDSWDFNCGMDPYGWICGKGHKCGDSCYSDLRNIRFVPSGWAPFNRTVQYCLSKRQEQHCKLKFSQQIGIIVAVMNLVKVACLAYTALFISESSLMTVGDAVSSFLSNPDVGTEGMCLISKHTITSTDSSHWRLPRQWTPTRLRWFKAASRNRWIACIVM